MKTQLRVCSGFRRGDVVKCPVSGVPRGFALVVTISMMILLVVLVTGLLSLSAVSLRIAGSGDAATLARSNARLGLMLALGELQETSGSDRRITADADILGGSVPRPMMAGVWESWTPNLTAKPTNSRPDFVNGASSYESQHDQNFKRWLVSGPVEARSAVDYGSAAVGEEAVELFALEHDGFELAAERTPVTTGTGASGRGNTAWAVVQEGTRAKMTVAGADSPLTEVVNADLEAQPRPSLGVAEDLGEPEGEWNLRAAKVINFSQAKLDGALWQGDNAVAAGRDFTTKSMGLLTDAVVGGLKTDLSLGFELSDSDFESENWNVDGRTIPNPFRAGAVPFRIPASYANQRALYAPLSGNGIHTEELEFWPANVSFHLPVKSSPTFDLLRSYYRTYKHVYQTTDGATIFSRESDHVASPRGRTKGGSFPPPAQYFEGKETQHGYQVVADRVMFLISVAVAANDELRIGFTPLVTLWNPYNVALEIEGAVSYMWIDIPFGTSWTVFGASGARNLDVPGMSTLMGQQFLNQGHGRSVDPYFFAALTADGNPIGSGRATPIRFEPGEVRVFAPASPVMKDFQVAGSVRERTVFLRPVDNISQYTTRGGIAVPLRNPVRNVGVTHRLTREESVQMSFYAVTGEDYPFFITLEDATRARNPNDTGTAIVDVLSRYFARSGATVSFQSPRIGYADLKREPKVIGTLETYHRVARSGGSAQTADLLYTGNPRQAFMNPYVMPGTKFTTGPQYQIRMRAISSINEAMQTTDGGRRAFYGASQTPIGGKTHLSFFEVPRSPMISLVGFQHADLAIHPFASANQFGNSWASAYVPRNRVYADARAVDHTYLANEALWDSFFLSSAAPRPGTGGGAGGGSPDAWEQENSVGRSLSSVLGDFLENPQANPLPNPRMVPVPGTSEEILNDLLGPAGSRLIAAHLMVDGAFNVNSTSIEAWRAVLSGMRDRSFQLGNGASVSNNGSTPFPRFRNPVGEAGDFWNGFRQLEDGEIEAIATALVDEVRSRGPFLSLGEFVNRRVESSELGVKGALQAAIDATDVNQAVLQDKMDVTNYPRSAQENIEPANTAVGIPGYVTQADMLRSIAPTLTVRSDTFTIRSYGEALDSNRNVIAKAWVEATVQRMPDFVDPSDPADLAEAELKPLNAAMGRRYEIISFRYLSPQEILN